MKKTKLRKVIVTYCDYCGKEINPPYTTLRNPDNKNYDLCNDYKEGEKTCLDKFKEKMNNEIKHKTE